MLRIRWLTGSKVMRKQFCASGAGGEPAITNNWIHALLNIVTGKTIAITVFEVLIYHSVLHQIHQIADMVS